MPGRFLLSDSGCSAVRMFEIRVNASADSAMGIEHDPVLHFDGPDGRVPDVIAAYRAGSQGPSIFVVHVGGYECSNVHLVRIDRDTARKLTADKHYYSCAR
jgi:hypothetical protein